MNDRDRELLLEFKKRLPSDLSNQIKRLIVFGSRVKGEAQEESDLDVIALVNEKTPEIENLLSDIVYQVMWDYDFKPIISLKVFSESQFYNALNRGDLNLNEEIIKLIEKAEPALEMTEKLINSGYPSDAASKTYYSMYYAAQALFERGAWTLEYN